MSIDRRRRALLIAACLAPAARALALPRPAPAEGPLDLIRRALDGLASPRQRAAMGETRAGAGGVALAQRLDLNADETGSVTDKR
ncbi:MAG: hypothetical protein LBU76_02410 [Azoarcus sp.]|jgi:hypothetical protein|nr:hypothetical protein [Azoarcus sp.]